MKTKFPKFDSYICIGDTIKWQKEGFDFVATIENDPDSRPEDNDCYSPLKIKQWKNDKWFFVGVVLSVSKNDVEITDHAASLWGIECNYNKKANRYLSDVAQELEREALDCAKRRLAEILGALQS